MKQLLPLLSYKVPVMAGLLNKMAAGDDPEELIDF